MDLLWLGLGEAAREAKGERGKGREGKKEGKKEAELCRQKLMIEVLRCGER